MFGHLTEYWFAFPVVALGCTMTIMGGVGGNVVCGPFFILVLKLSPEAAIGTALVTQVFSLLSGIIGYGRRKLIDYRLALFLAVGAVPAAVLGSWLSVRVPGTLLQVIFGGVILIIAWLLYRSPIETAQEAMVSPGASGVRTLIDRQGRVYSYQVCQRGQLLGISVLAGLGSGLVAIGGGELNTPAMVLRCQIPIRIAAATAVFTMALTVLAGAITHVLVGRPVWNLALWTIPGAILGGQLGSYLASRIESEALKRGLSLLFVLVGMAMIVHAMFLT
ncbi:hypothetical protein HRbin10_00689 [bacterium HR10]|uniref:Probable membrane transporter protein n=1 Tax=uncultured Acidobacteriota bacterium TaxID=171953 RepID=H5SG37_9BACT|nr:hypothetical conserved protein [uncultured Acidobacteriota bacterium]GBC81577.1 hypothetical protein HRbin10_00689 [bacterium HR10]